MEVYTNGEINGHDEFDEEDGEPFDATIIYNPDGSAYIIEADDDDDEDLLQLPKQDGSIIVNKKAPLPDDDVSIPQIASALFLHRSNTTLYNTLFSRRTPPPTPTMHSYRVYDVRHPPPRMNTKTTNLPNVPVTVPTRPILMCFICKMSFGVSKSFISHAIGEHSMDLLQAEEDILSQTNSSAIIQAVGKDKTPLMSFLEPYFPPPPPSTSPISDVESSASSTNSPPPSAAVISRAMPPLLAAAAVTSFPPPMPPPPSMAAIDLATLSPSRSSCKTLKCPKCNWHYKYQETLEIHMKEKHPADGESSSCVYCVTKAAHPRLARGEAYTCGYKPYRCEVCNYSTTTKGNLSIHMQSDKHINNMQDLQNGSTPAPPPTTAPSAPPTPPSSLATSSTTNQATSSNQGSDKNKSKPVWRCDVCQYETNVARNLRIHMTSEKHTHNMMMLQQSMRMALPPLLFPPTTDPYYSTPLLTSTTAMVEPLPDVFECCVCNVFATDSVESLHGHMQLDRTRVNGADAEFVSVVAGQHTCSLCSYKTPLKANFQLHSKTDKHVQRLQLALHVREGGPENAWRGKYVNVSNPVQVRCSACDFYTNSLHKLHAHSMTPAHGAAVRILQHVQMAESHVPADKRLFVCPVCSYSTRSKNKILQHSRTPQHASNLQGRSEDELGSVLRVRQADDNNTDRESQEECTPPGDDRDKDNNDGGLTSYENEVVNEDGMRPRTEEEDEEGVIEALEAAEQATKEGVTVDEQDEDDCKCHTCSNTFPTLDALYNHQNELGHLELKQTPRGPGYLCWKKSCNQYFSTANALQVHYREIHATPTAQNSSTSRRHAYKFRCSRCSLAFVTRDKLQLHHTYHVIRAATRCPVCDKNFRSIAALRKHVDNSHLDKMSDEEIAKYRATLAEVAPLIGLKLTDDPSANNEDINANSVITQDASYSDPACKYKCHRCRVGYARQSALVEHNKSAEHKRSNSSVSTTSGSSTPTLAITATTTITGTTQESESSADEKFNDPSKPFKCHVCVEAFAQRNNLEVHESSNSHKQRVKEEESGSEPPIAPLGWNFNDPNKPYRCNLCKVSFANSPNFDIHKRSVLHMKHISRLPDYINRNCWQSDGVVLETPDGKMSAEDVRESATNTIKKEDQISSPLPSTLPTANPTTTGTTLPSTIMPNQNAISGNNMGDNDEINLKMAIAKKRKDCLENKENNTPKAFTCSRCSSVFKTADSLEKHEGGECLGPPIVKLGRVKPALQRHLLESFGFECVMQYNENQKREVLKPCPDEESVGKKPPELLEKRTCSKCNKNFSSVWVLKAHEEEIHENLVPHDIVQKVATKFRSDYDKKQPSSSMPNENRSSGTPTPTALQEEKILASTGSSGFSQVMIKDEMPSVSCTDIASQMMQMPMLMPFAGMPLFMPPILPYPGMELAYAGLGAPSNAAAIFDPTSNVKQQATAAQLATSNPKRARTRINDDQLKILRAHFDINNSPTEAQIERMSRESGLPPKVIKHWFRNTLFKERQRNKDSPYNFNNPPSTTLDLAEYEKTGKIKSEATAKNEHLANSENMKSIEKDIDSQADVESVASFSESAVSSAPSTPVPPQPSNEIMNALTQANLAKAMAPLTPEMLMQVTSMTSSQDGTIPGSSTTPKRANRTRFTDHQVKTLQEYFEQNAYPKDDELEHLSKTLQLSPRVIVVWFQNARQKARKSYENQPPSSSEKNATNSHSSSSNEDERYVKTPGSNYQCKRCSTVFQRYYELIKHQKSVCFKEEETPLSSCNNSNDGTSSSPPSKVDVNSSANGKDQPQQQQQQQHLQPQQQKAYDCDKCSQSFVDPESWREHQNLHLATPPVFPSFHDSAFAILQNVAKQAEANKQFKRKSDDDQDSNNSGESCPSRDKRLRTTILPEQLDYLYQKYQADSNPSRKQLESIADEVGLKKRVVQVWFQNTRARERKGQYRAHAQLIHKRCPFCRALFRAKTALESHLATKHPEEMAKGEVNVDNIPDCPIEPPALKDKESPTPSLDMTKLLSNPYNVPSNPVLFPPGQAASFKKMYEEQLNKFMSETSPAATISSGVGTSTPSSTSTPSAQTPISASSKVDRRKSATPQRAVPTVPTVLEDPSAPLDLSARAPSTPVTHVTPIRHYEDDNRSETYSESTTDGIDFMDETSNPSSPPSAHMAHGHGGSSGGLSGGSHRPAKRYRTQMTSLQIGVMKSLFDWYRTPSMSECELLGSEISLPKRVVQVWFQNARAKEKKARLAQGQPVDEPPRTPDSCSLCNFTFTHNYSVQDHIFTKRHIQNAMNHMRKQLESEGVRDTSIPKVETPTGSSNARSKPSKLEMGDNEKSRRSGNTSGTGGTSPLVSAGLNAQMMSMLGMPGSDLMMPLFLPSSAPGFPLTAGGLAPFMSGLAPGDLMYDPTRFGTPLQMLQIPQAAISKVQKQLNTANATSAYYTQDCSSIKEVSEQVGIDVVTASSVDVGYICRKCQMVYPAKEGCLQHQSSSCYAGQTPKTEHMLKLEQRLYKCVVCSDKLPTKKDFLRHCTSESHKTQAPPSAKKIKLNN